MATIEKFKKVINGIKQDVFPVTKTSAVIDNDNNNLDTVLAGKQNNLVSGTNIKTINGDSVIGSGNLTITTVSGHTVGANVPSDASFTDHITSVSESGTGNAVTDITADADGNLTVTKGSTFLDSLPIASNSVLGAIKVGNGLSIANGVLSANSGSDVSVTQTATTTSGSYPILIKNTTETTTVTDTARFSPSVTVNPGTGTVIAANFSGNGSGLTNVNASTVSNYTVGVNVPSNAVFTDHITTATVAGSGNAITNISADANGAITATKGETFLTEHQSLDDYAKTSYVDDQDDAVLNSAKTYTDSLVTSAVRIKGVMSTVAEVLAVTTAKVGDMYIVTADNSEWVCIKDISVATANAWEMLGTVSVNGALFKDTNVFTDGYVLEADGSDGKVKAVQPTSDLVGLGNLTNDRQIKGLSSGTTANHVVTWGTDGYSVKDSGYTISSNVPSHAVFTDTITSATTTGTGNAVTSVTADASGQLTVTKGDTFLTRIDPATTTTIGGVIVGSGLSVDSLGVLSSDATDTKVTQTAEVSGSTLSYPLITKYSSGKADETDSVRWTNGANYVPSTGTISATRFSGDGAQITNVNAVTVNGYSVNAAVPSTAVFTDTHRPIQANGSQILGNNTTALNIKSGDNVDFGINGGAITINAVDEAVKQNEMTGVGIVDTPILAQGDPEVDGNGGAVYSTLIRIQDNERLVSPIFGNQDQTSQFEGNFAGDGADIANVNASTVNNHTVLSNVPNNAIFTDHYVYQINTSSNYSFPVLVKDTSTSASDTSAVRFTTKVTINTSSGQITASKFSGDGSSLRNVDASTLEGHPSSYFQRALTAGNSITISNNTISVNTSGSVISNINSSINALTTTGQQIRTDVNANTSEINTLKTRATSIEDELRATNEKKQDRLDLAQGYDANKRQILINDQGTYKWIEYREIIMGTDSPTAGQGQNNDMYIQTDE